jgi:formate C-acetyltransferase
MQATNESGGFGSTARTKRLKADRVYPGVADEVVEYTKEERTPGQVDFLKELKTHIRTYSKICIERARYYTEAYRESEGEPEVLRVAKGVANVFDNMTIYIEPDALIVGNCASEPTAMPIYPDFYCKWIEPAIRPGGMFEGRVNDEERKELIDIANYWTGRSFGDRMRAAMPPNLSNFVEFNGCTATVEYYESHSPISTGHERVMQLGTDGIVKECREKLKEVQDEGVSKGKTPEEYLAQVDNLNAIIIANEAFGRLGKRYSKLAQEMAKNEKDAQRKKDLEKIAEVCGRVPSEPARNLHEALQCFFLSHLVQTAVSSRCFGSSCRFDYIFNPYFQKDKENGILTREEAQELVEALWVKIEGISLMRPPEAEAASVGATTFQTITLGGIDAKGRDATNEMSYIAIDASMAVHTIQPTIVVRYHSKIDPNFIDKSTDCIRTGLGFPCFISDQATFPQFIRRGVPEDEVWNWVAPSCISRVMPNVNMRQGGATAAYFGYGKCFDLALNDGYDRWLGKQLGPKTGDPSTFKSIDDFKEAYLKQVDFVCGQAIQVYNISEAIRCRYMKRPLVSGFLKDCVERGLTTTDFSVYDNYNVPEMQVLGAINVADSLTAIKKFVFEEKKLTIDELLDACRSNWEGKEEIRQMCLNAPKYGNDIDEADEMAQWVHWESNETLMKHTDYWGAPIRAQGSITSAYYSFGRATPATPDGRWDSEPLADGTSSPMAGRDTKGPTATLSSVGKLDPLKGNELLLNQKFMPQFLEGENKKLFADYLKTWHDLGCYHVQFNVVDKNVLMVAQEKPESYPDLVVRVAGYSSYWVDLGKPMQDDIIKRTEQSFAC